MFLKISKYSQIILIYGANPVNLVQSKIILHRSQPLLFGYKYYDRKVSPSAQENVNSFGAYTRTKFATFIDENLANRYLQ